MPQGRRKTPFSGKAKKEQLKAKKQSKALIIDSKKPFNPSLIKNHETEGEPSSNIMKLNFQPSSDGLRTNKYVLQFHTESKSELKHRRELASLLLTKVPEQELEIDSSQFFPHELDFPKRPAWSFDMSKDKVEAEEQRYFMEYVSNIEKKFNWKDLSYFELNLETWRQLWRVLEMSDIILFIVDIRYAGLMFPPYLYEYVRNVLKKDIILILNKIDLAPIPIVVGWKNYFKEKYPDLHVLMFTTMPAYNLLGKLNDKAGLKIRRRKGRIRMAAEGAQLLLDTCKQIVGTSVDLSSWQEKIKEEMSAEFDDDEATEIGETITVKNNTEYFEHEKYKGGILTIGCLGQPNVGKSSLMNAVMGKKVVSVSKTPGHTKHFQTIFLTNNVKLCDCPGLVFPSRVPKPLQILMGSFPIAQVKEPFTTVKYLGERLDLVRLLRIDHPDGDEEWSALDICDGWAKKRGYLTAKAARLDSYRAANSILRMALDGKICLNLLPLNYLEKKNYWENHPDVEIVKWILAQKLETNEKDEEEEFELSDEDRNLERAVALEKLEHRSSNNDDSESSNDDIEEPNFSSTNKFAALNIED